MKQEKVSFRQLMALLWAGLLGPAAEWLPSMVTERAGPAGWLVPLLALPVLLAAGWLAGSLSRGAGGLSQGLMDSFGPGAGRAVLTIYIIWMELLLALRLRLSAQRMMAAGERDGALWFFLPVLVLMALWISWGKAGRLARTGGRFALVYRPERLAELFAALAAARLEPKRMQLLAYDRRKPPYAVLVEAVKDGGPGLEVLPVHYQMEP